MKPLPGEFGILIATLPFLLASAHCRSRDGQVVDESLNAYHWEGGEPFYEGWYFKVSAPDIERSFVFIYGVLNPGGTSPHSQGFVVVAMNGEDVAGSIYERFDADAFRSSRETFDVSVGPRNRARGDGDMLHLEGSVSGGGGSASWEIDLSIEARGTHELGILKLVPSLQTDWFVHAMDARATGWVRWDGQDFELDDALGYQEKNWGRAFPTRWYWMQANHFDDPGACCLSVAGGALPVGPILAEGWGIGFRYRGELYTFNKPMEFASVAHRIEPGSWEVSARKSRHRIVISGSCDPEDMLNLPNPTEDGMKYLTWETVAGRIRVRLFEKVKRQWVLMVDTESDYAGLEVGGEEWRSGLSADERPK